MMFKFNTANLGGTDLVIFESLYYDGKLILEHKDINNTDETVSVTAPAPNTGSFTMITTKDTEDNQIVFIVIGIASVNIGGYIVYRYVARKKFYKRV